MADPTVITTATSRDIRANFRANRLLQAVTVAYAVLWLVCAIDPVNRFDWFLENILLFIAIGGLAATYRKAPFSDLSYVLIAVFFSLHTVGSHYTYSETPAGFWIEDVLGLRRNDYDRLVHFCFGLLIAYPLRELALRGAKLAGFWSYFLALAVIMASSATYEIIEWVVAVVVNPKDAMAYVGTQGDAFDTQKDVTLAASGALLSLAFMALATKSWPAAPGRSRGGDK